MSPLEQILAALKDDPYIKRHAEQVWKWQEKHNLHVGDELIATEAFHALMATRPKVGFSDDTDLDRRFAAAEANFRAVGARLKIAEINPETDTVWVANGAMSTGNISLPLVLEMRAMFLGADHDR